MTTMRSFLSGLAIGATVTGGGVVASSAVAADVSPAGFRGVVSDEHKWCSMQVDLVTGEDGRRSVTSQNAAVLCADARKIIDGAVLIDLRKTDVDARGRLDADDYVDGLAAR